jgi:hypothetical protein
MIPAPPGHFDVALLETPAPGNTQAARPFLHARLSPGARLFQSRNHVAYR